MYKHSTLLLSTFIILGLTACNNSLHFRTKYHKRHYKTDNKQPALMRIKYLKPTPKKEEAFRKTMHKVAKSTLTDTHYKKMILDTPEKKVWFKKLMYLLWDRQITIGQFIAAGLAKYPTHHYEFSFVAKGFQKNS